MSKTQILNRVQTALAKNHIAKTEVHFKDILKSENPDLLEEYKHFQKSNRANVIESSPQNLSADVLRALNDLGAKKVLHTLDLPFDVASLAGDFEKIAYDKCVEDMRAELFDMDTSIIKGVCGVANLGIIGVVSSPLSPRLASLITLNCVILLDKTQIVKDLYAGIEALKKESKDGVLPTNLLFIAGPSRTADIELQTVFGVHGPQNVVIILY
ncbi:lactate utilization protein C [Helicobacter sp. 11S02596-1]|uniref:LutC/YkgG family protein n=1 Tax=Helicobacter sp. 11S02596-1 TaxID=1476194 RepID=UPI000BA7D547|nr:lactate utilization protein C [Helicobacter sp. 11S02596-1]PAF42362.1 lactate utilization protein C [Helicobacter sp. 11S02596-1]